MSLEQDLLRSLRAEGLTPRIVPNQTSPRGNSVIIFRNTGLIDLAAVRTLGVSVKEEGAIGYFGTGLKFAIATILRGGGSISIFRGKHEHRFGTVEKDVRGKPFQIVTMDGQELGFTTSLGRDWKPWMAFRELACNALDEGGRFYCERYDIGEIASDETVIVVQSEEIEDAYHERGDILLETSPVHANEYIEIRPGESRFIYYRNVRVGMLSYPSKHTYNLLRKLDLTEDRTIKYDWEADAQVALGLAKCDDESLLAPALGCGEKFFEHNLSFREQHKPSQAFLRVAAGLRGRLDNIANANPSALSLARLMSLSDLGPADSVILNPIEQMRYDRARAFLSSAGYAVDKYPITIVEDLGDGVQGLAKENRIFLAKSAFQKGTKEVAATLFEEFVHLKTGYGDATRQLQTWLMDELLSQAEKMAGVAL
jgi:hypothetical protein